MLKVRIIAGAIAAAASLFASGLAAEPRGEAWFAAADHHMHIVSPAAYGAMQAFCDKVGRDQCGDTWKGPSYAADAVQALDAAKIRRGVLLSTAYIAGSKEMAAAPEEVARAMRAENAFVVEQARLSCGRLVAFISVNPLLDNAVDEIAYWGRTGGATGLKLHLTNSDFDFRSPGQVRKLAAVFKAAADAHFAIIIHMRTRDFQHYGAADAETFIHEVLPAAGDLPVQVAHVAGWGGVDDQTLAALGAFARAFRTNPGLMRHVYFDLAAIPDMPKTPATAAQVAALDDLMRRIGIDRFLLASDWTKGMDLAVYYAVQQARLAMTPDEWRVLRSTEAPYLQAAGRRLSESCARTGS